MCFVFQIQHVAGSRLSESLWRDEGSEGFSSDVTRTGAYSPQFVQLQGAWCVDSQGKTHTAVTDCLAVDTHRI